jgi:hypothetical protein
MTPTEAMIEAARETASEDCLLFISEGWMRHILKAALAVAPRKEALKRCNICGFVIDTTYAPEKPTVQPGRGGKKK